MRTDSRLHAPQSHQQAEWSVTRIGLFKKIEERFEREIMEIVEFFFFFFFGCATVKMSERLLKPLYSIYTLFRAGFTILFWVLSQGFPCREWGVEVRLS